MCFRWSQASSFVQRISSERQMMAIAHPATSGVTLLCVITFLLCVQDHAQLPVAFRPDSIFLILSTHLRHSPFTSSLLLLLLLPTALRIGMASRWPVFYEGVQFRQELAQPHKCRHGFRVGGG